MGYSIGDHRYWEAREREIAAEMEYNSRPEVRRENEIHRLEIDIAIYERDGYIIENSAEKLVAAKAQLAELKPAPEMTKAQVLAKWAPIMGISVAKAQKLAQHYSGNWDRQPASRFSSIEIHEHFCGMMRDYIG